MSEYLPQLGYLVLLLIAIGGFLVAEFRTDAAKTARQALAWGLIFLGVLAAAGLWDSISRTVSPQQIMLTGDKIEVPISRDGHYYLNAELNGETVTFVVDTGATGIALTQSDAQKIGIDTSKLAYINRAQTANGSVGTAPVLIDDFRIGDISDQRVMAQVLDGDLFTSLLGMSYLSKFARLSIEGDRLILER